MNAMYEAVLAAWGLTANSAGITGFVFSLSWELYNTFLNVAYWLIGGLDAIPTRVRVFLAIAVVLFSSLKSRRRHAGITRRFSLLRRLFTRHLKIDDGIRADWQANFCLPYIKPQPDHSHGVSAANRTSASFAIDSFIRRRGMLSYVVSSSGRELESSDGFHQWHALRDLNFDEKADTVTDNHILKMVDVDYYLDMEEWAQYERPMLLYTFVPTSVASSKPEYNYRIEGDHVIYETYGGNRYRHQVWNYSKDYVIFKTGYFTRVVYSVDSKQVDEHHRVILLAPIMRLFSLWGYWSRFDEDGLRRLKSTLTNGTCMLRYTTPKGDVISVRPQNISVAVDMPVRVFEAAQIRFNASTAPMMSDLNRYLKEAKLEDTDSNAAILYEALKSGVYVVGEVDVAKAGIAREAKTKQLEHFQGVGPLVDEDGKEIGRSVAPALVKYPDVVPNKSYNNDWLSIENRVKKVTNNFDVPSRFTKYADEFVTLVLGEHAGVGAPFDHDVVRMYQSKPMQRARLAKSQHWLLSEPAINVRSFMKQESYGKVNAPRNISTVGVTHTIQLSSYTYSFKQQVLYPYHWYAPGKTPKQIAERIATLGMSFDKLSETDYEKFDGTISYWLRDNVERAMYMRWCHPEHRQALAAVLDVEINQYARTAHGLPYEPKASRLSGSPLTTDGNTLINAFVSFAAYREAKISAEHAFKFLGVYGGDDGVTPVAGVHLDKAAHLLGLKLKCETRRNGDIVCFLGRVFPNAWGGDLGSIQDPMRTWKKLHISFANKNLSDQQALADRALGYLLLDPKAPVTATWCRKALEACGKVGRINDIDTPFFVRSENMETTAKGIIIKTKDEQHYEMIGKTIIPLETNSWPQLGYDLAIEAIAKSTGFLASEIEVFDNTIRDSASLEEVEGLIHNTPVAPAVEAAVGHDIVRPPASTATIDTVVVARVPRRRQHRSNKDQPRENISHGASKGNRSVGRKRPTQSEPGSNGRRDRPHEVIKRTRATNKLNVRVPAGPRSIR